MNLSQLRYVVAVDRRRHFTQAAEECGVTQPTLSMQVKKLEGEMGVEIFHRTRIRVQPTDIGREIVAQARTVLQEVDRLHELVGEAGGEVAGELRVGVIPTVGPFVLPRCLPALMRRHPELSLVVEELKTSDLLDKLRSHQLDAALLATRSDSSDLLRRNLFEEPFVGYLSPGHRLSARVKLRREDLRLDDLWLLQEGHCFRDQVLDLCSSLASSSGPARPLSFESGNLNTLKRLVDESGGMTLLPRLAVDELSEEERSRVRPFESPSPSRTVCFVHGRTYLKRAAREALVEELLRSIPEDRVALTPP